MEFIEFLMWIVIVVIGIPIAVILFFALLWGIIKILITLAVATGTVLALVAVAYVVFLVLEQLGYLPPNTLSEGIAEFLREIKPQ